MEDMKQKETIDTTVPVMTKQKPKQILAFSKRKALREQEKQ
jgi:hypothetical protein